MNDDSLSRREALAAMAATVGVAACGAGDGDGPAGGSSSRDADPDAGAGADRPIWVKDASPFIRHGTNLESRLEDMHGLITPNELFFVRNHAPTPLIDAGSYVLAVGGSGAEREVRLGLDELRALPSQTLVAYIECAGNWRGFFRPVTGRTASGKPVGHRSGGVRGMERAEAGRRAGAGGRARRRGRRERHRARRGGVGAADAAREGARSGHDPGAHHERGVPLPPDHGFPVRAVVPGWVGSSSVKWVGRIDDRDKRRCGCGPTRPRTCWWETEWPADRYAPADGAPITAGRVKSALALPRPARLEPPGRSGCRGFAWSPRAAGGGGWSGWSGARTVDGGRGRG